MTSSAAGQWLNMYNLASGFWWGTGNNTSVVNGQVRMYIPCKKGDQASVTYNMAGSSTKYDYFIFVYAEGDQ